MKIKIALLSLLLVGGGCVASQDTVVESTDMEIGTVESLGQAVPGSEGVEDMVIVEDGDSEAPGEVNELPNQESAVKTFEVTAKQWEFSPSTITVNEGDTVVMNVTSVDVDHSIKLAQFGVDQFLTPGSTERIEFVADKAGEYSFICAVFCGSGHKDMTGTLIVK